MFKGFTVEDKDDPVKILALNEKRDRAVEIFQKLALKELSNAPISVKRQVSCFNRLRESADRQAFIAYVNVHILFSSKSENALPAAQACPLVMPSEIQSRLGGAFQAAVERYATDKEINGEEESQADNDGKLALPGLVQKLIIRLLA
jgi:cohesin complex subunit SA-1/2